MYTCKVCAQEFTKQQGLSSHSRVHKNSVSVKPGKAKLVRKQVVKQVKPVVEDNPFSIAQDVQVEEPNSENNVPSLAEFSSWLDDIPDEPEKQIIEETQDSQIDEVFALTIEQYIQFLDMINNFLDTIVVLLGGDETYGQVGRSQLKNFATQLKLYGDSKNFKLSPEKMLLISFSLMYLVPTGSAINSIRKNRLEERKTKMLEQKVKIEPIKNEQSRNN